MTTSKPGGEYDYPWERWSDGRVWRLRRGRDFKVSPRTFRRHASAAAQELGKEIHSLADPISPNKVVWLQFAQGILEADRPCPCCGGLEFQELRSGWVRCESCKRLLAWSSDAVAARVELQEDEEAPAWFRAGSSFLTRFRGKRGSLE